MADRNSQLNLRISATNEASPVFEAVAQSIGQVTSMLNSVSGTFEESARAISAAADAGRTMNTVLGEESQSFSTAVQGTHSFDEALMSVETAISSVTMAVRSQTQVMQEMGKATRSSTESQLGALIAVQQLGQALEHLGSQGEEVFKYAIEQGADFQQSMKNIQTVIAANVTTNESWNNKLQDASQLTGELQQKALELGSRGAQSANAVSEAMDAMLRGGVDANTILSGAIESAQNVAIVTGDKLDESANLITEIFHLFREQFQENGKSIQENMKETGDVLTGTLLSARINSNDFITTLKYVGPVASQLGAGFTDTATAAALLAQNGIKGSQAGTTLRRALTNLLEPTKQGSEAMKALGLIQNGNNVLIDQSTGKMKNLTDIQEILHRSMDGLTEAQKAKYTHDIFGQYALAGTLVLANENSEAFSNLKSKIEGVSASDAAASMLDTFSGHMQQLESHVATTAKEFGMSFLPTLNQLLPIGNEILNWLQSMTDAHKTLLMGVLGAGSALVVLGGGLMTIGVSAKYAKEGFTALQDIFTGAISVIPKTITYFQEFAAAVRDVGLAEAIMDAFNPLGWVVLIGAAIAAVAYVVYNNWDAIKTFTMQVWDDLTKWLTTTWNAITTTSKSAWNATVQAITGVWTGTKQWLSDTWTSISTSCTQAWTGLVTGVQNVWNGFKTWIVDANNAINTALVQGFEWLYNHNYYFKDLVDFITQWWNNCKQQTQAIWTAIQTFVNTTWNWFTTTSNTVFTALGNFFTQVWTGIEKVATELWNDIKTALNTAWTAIVTLADTVWTPIEQFFSDIWNSVSSTASSEWSSITSAMETAWNGAVTQAEQIWDGLKTYFEGLWDQAYNWGSTLISKFIDGIKSMASALMQEVSSLASSVASSISSALGFHDIGSSSSSSGGGFDNSGGGDMQGWDGMDSAPAFAQGGVVTKKTLAWVGDGGEPEYIIPQSYLTGQNGYTLGLGGLSAAGVRGGTGGGVTINGMTVQINGARGNPNTWASDFASALRNEVKFTFR